VHSRGFFFVLKMASHTDLPERSKANGEEQKQTQQEMDSQHFSPYRADGKLYGFVCVVTGALQPVGQAIIKELAGEFLNLLYHFSYLFSFSV